MAADIHCKSLVLYCLIRRPDPGSGAVQFLLLEKSGSPTFPPTKFRPGEDLYHALARPMGEDLKLPESSYFPELELGMIPSSGKSARYPGVTPEWNLYPVDVSLTAEGYEALARGPVVYWWTLAEILKRVKEPNILAIANYIQHHKLQLLSGARHAPSMDAIASHWAVQQCEGVRVVRRDELRKILSSGGQAFNLRVADPYLPYQRQGMGFTWSFFTPKHAQDLHLHSMPAVELYAVLEGRLQLWSKPLGQRGVRTWKCTTLEAGDWAEVEPLQCHFACWLVPEGVGTVIRAAGPGELAGVGCIGAVGKTVCQDCNMEGRCSLPTKMVELIAEYQKPFEDRDYTRIRELATEGERDQSL